MKRKANGQPRKRERKSKGTIRKQMGIKLKPFEYGQQNSKCQRVSQTNLSIAHVPPSPMFVSGKIPWKSFEKSFPVRRKNANSSTHKANHNVSLHKFSVLCNGGATKNQRNEHPANLPPTPSEILMNCVAGK